MLKNTFADVSFNNGQEENSKINKGSRQGGVQTVRELSHFFVPSQTGIFLNCRPRKFCRKNFYSLLRHLILVYTGLFWFIPNNIKYYLVYNI